MPNDRRQLTTKNGLSRRRLMGSALSAGTLLGAPGLIAGCSGGERQPQTAEGQQAERGGLGNVYTDEAAKELNDSLSWPETAVSEPDSEVVLTIAHHWEASFMPRQEQFDRFFMERHPNIKLQNEITPFADYLQKYITQLAGGTVPDVMYCQFAWAQNFIKRGVFLALDDYIGQQPDFDRDDFTAPSLGYYERDGSLYGIAYDCGPIMLYYNKELFDSAGLDYPTSDWTMEDMRDAAVELTSGSGGSKVFGLHQIPTPGGDFTPTFLAPFGGTYVNDDESASLLDTPESVEAAQWWMDIYLEHGAMPSPSDAQAIGADLNAFTVGRAAMSYQGSWATPGLIEQADFEWAIADWPVGPVEQSTGALGSCFAITEESKNKDAAWIYLNELLSTAGQIFMWASTGRGSPARNSAWDAYLESEFAPEGADLIQDALNNYGTDEGVLHQPAGPEVTSAAEPIWDRVISGRLSVEEGCREITETIDPILETNLE